MAHPQMFRDDDPYLARLRGLAGTLPEVVEVVSHGRPCFKAGEKGKQFAVFGGGPKGGDRIDTSLLVVADPAELLAFDEDERFFIPAYYGPAGWRALDLAAPDTDWQEVAELLDASYRQVARVGLLKQLDAEG